MSSWTLRIFFVVTAVIVVGSELGHRRRMDVHHDMLALRATDTVELQRELAQQRLRLLIADTLIAAAHTDLEDWVEAGSEEETALSRLEQEFVRMSDLRDVYCQIRLIDGEGMERVRIDRKDGVTRRVPREDLQDKRHRYYFEEASRLPSGMIYISPFDFNVERGVAELPARPVFHFVTPVRSAGGALEAIVALNYDANDLLELIERTESHPGLEGFLLDAEGRDLLGPVVSGSGDQAELAWPLLDARFPEEARRIREERSGQIQTENGIFTFATVDPWESVSSIAAPVDGSERVDRRLELVHRIPASVLSAAASADRRAWWIPLAFFELLTLLAAFVIARLLHQRRTAHLALERRAEVDPLTGLWNRRKLFEFAAQELRRSRRFEKPLSVALLDLDLFKRINDDFGHQVGDEVLRATARAMLDESREVDVVSRYGGEEFLVLFPETDEAGACAMADRVREAIARATTEALADEGCTVTVSIGVAEHQADESLDELLNRADDALYAAKRGGRDRVVAHSSRDLVESLDMKEPRLSVV